MLKHDSSRSDLRAGGGRVVAASSSSAVNTMIKTKTTELLFSFRYFYAYLFLSELFTARFCGEGRRGRCRESRRLDAADGFLAADASIAALLWIATKRNSSVGVLESALPLGNNITFSDASYTPCALGVFLFCVCVDPANRNWLEEMAFYDSSPNTGMGSFR